MPRRCAGCEVNLNTEGLSAREVKTFKVTGQAELALDTFDGAIELHSWDRNEIEVEIEKRAMEQALLDEIKVDAQQEGDKIIVKVTGPARGEHRGMTIGVHISPTARLRVAVPRNTNINAMSGDGSIRAEAIEGQHRPAHHRRQRHRHAARRRHPDPIGRRLDPHRRRHRQARSRDRLTAASASKRSRACCARAPATDRFAPRIEPDTVMTDNWDITTSDGSVTVTLPGAVQRRARRRNERRLGARPIIRCSDDDRDDRRDGEGRDERRERRRTLRAKMGDGGKILRIRTGDGTIRIER